ncbi:MAG: glycosyltransferase family 4 protein [Nanoarchaeota archaeon]|nr:glycosyltransferase family 4 protein [Nanoarchaeota archaeon]
MAIITFLASLSLESPNGIGRYFPIAKELVKKGHHVNIIALHHNFKSLKEKSFVKEGVDIYYVGQMQVLKINDTKIYLNKLQLIKTVFLSTLKMCLKSLSLKSDVIYLFKPQPINGTAALLTKLLKRKKLFVDCDDYEALSNKLSKLEKAAFMLFEDKLPKLADKVTIHNSFLKERYQNLGIKEKNLIYLPNGIDVERFENVDEDKILKLKEEFNLKDKKVVLYFGSLSLKSGHTIDLLLKSFVLVKRKIKNSVLMLVGGGEDIELLKKYSNNLGINSIIFTGRVDANEIPNYIKLGDVTVDPIEDSFANRARSPLKIVESMALGVPVVTGDVGDRRKITKGKTAVLVKAGDKKELAEGIIKILSDDKLAKKISEDSLKLVKNYQWRKLTNIVHNLIDSNNSL